LETGATGAIGGLQGYRPLYSLSIPLIVVIERYPSYSTHLIVNLSLNSIQKIDQFSQYRENSDDSDASDSFISEGVAEYEVVLNGETFSDDEEDSLLPTIEEEEEEEVPRVASGSRFNSIGSRMLALIRMRDMGKDIDFEAIQAETGISRSSVYKLKKKAIDRGLNWDSGRIEPSYVDDVSRSGRPLLSKETKDLIEKIMTQNSTTRGYSCVKIAILVSATPGQVEVSASSVHRTLKERGYGTFKRTVKPGLNATQKNIRLKWCEEHKDWTLEDWKNVIFLDETSVQLSAVRGRRRIWRKKSKIYYPYIVTTR